MQYGCERIAVKWPQGKDSVPYCLLFSRIERVIEMLGKKWASWLAYKWLCCSLMLLNLFIGFCTENSGFFSHLCILLVKEKTLDHEFIDLGEVNNSKKNFSGCNS